MRTDGKIGPSRMGLRVGSHSLALSLSIPSTKGERRAEANEDGRAEEPRPNARIGRATSFFLIFCTPGPRVTGAGNRRKPTRKSDRPEEGDSLRWRARKRRAEIFPASVDLG
jgi:hypothetical protein